MLLNLVSVPLLHYAFVVTCIAPSYTKRSNFSHSLSRLNVAFPPCSLCFEVALGHHSLAWFLVAPLFQMLLCPINDGGITSSRMSTREKFGINNVTQFHSLCGSDDLLSLNLCHDATRIIVSKMVLPVILLARLHRLYERSVFF